MNRILVKDLLAEKESEWLDFKQQYHDNRVNLLHDILCLANSETSKKRYLIFGVADSGLIVGVKGCPNRKKQSEILDLLKNAPFNHLPRIALATVAYQGYEIDILEIENHPEKPYYFTKDKTHHGRTIRAGVCYTRYGDTNTPLDGCADELFLERMFRERFGIDKTSLERVKINSKKFRQWKYSESDSDGHYFHDEWNPEFTLTQSPGAHLEDFEEAWTQFFPDTNAYRYELFLNFHTTILRRLYVISCDGEDTSASCPSYGPIKTR